MSELLVGDGKSSGHTKWLRETTWGCQLCSFHRLKSFPGAAPEVTLEMSPGK